MTNLLPDDLSRLNTRDIIRIVMLMAVLCFFITLIPAQSQVLNVERVRAEGDTVSHWAGELKFDISLDRNRETVLNIGNEANAAYFSRRHTYMLLNSINFVRVESDDVVSKGFFHLRGTFNRINIWSPELFLQYQFNQNLGLEDRALAGGGIRYTFLQENKFSGHFNAGLMFERERWDVSDGTDITNNFLKNTFNVVLRGDLTEQVNLLTIAYYQARPDRFFTPRVTSENRLNFRMSERLAFTFNFTFTFDADPVIDIPSLTFELKNGILILI
ncbi:MAG: DUF481 domain-containing protein [Balneolaceae bacterium]